MKDGISEESLSIEEVSASNLKKSVQREVGTKILKEYEASFISFSPSSLEHIKQQEG